MLAEKKQNKSFTTADFPVIWGNPLQKFITRLEPSLVGQRGKSYASRGRVRVARLLAPNELEGLVQNSDEGEYLTRLVNNGSTITSICTCPYANSCKHGYALALVLARDGFRSDYWAPPEVQRAFPATWKKLIQPGLYYDVEGFAEFFPKPAAPKRRPVRLQKTAPAKPPLASLNGHAKSPWWRHYLETTANDERQQILIKAAASRLPNQHRGSYWLTGDASYPAAREPNLIKSLRLFQSKLESLAKAYSISGLASEPDLEAFLASDEANQLQERWDVEIAERTFLAWLDPRDTSHSANGRHTPAEKSVGEARVVWFAAPATGAIQALGARVLINNGGKKGMQPRATAGLVQIAREIQSGIRTYGPDMDDFLQWAGGIITSRRIYHDTSGDKAAIDVHDVFEWLASWTTRLPVYWQDTGEPVQLQPTPAQLTLVSTEQDPQPLWAVQFPADSKQVQSTVLLNQCTLFGESFNLRLKSDARILVRDGNRLFPLDTRGMPAGVLASISKLGYLPVQRVQQPMLRSRLAARLFGNGNGISAEGRRWIREVPCRPQLELRYDEYDEQLTLIARATVRSSAGEALANGVRFRYDFHGHWAAEEPPASKRQTANEAVTAIASDDQDEKSRTAPESETASQPDPDVVSQNAIAEMPRRQDVEELENWLRELAAPGVTAQTVAEPHAELQIKVNWSTTLHLLRAWYQRPAGVDYLGNPAFRRLITLRKPPRLSISVKRSEMEWLKISVRVEGELNELSDADVQEVLSAAHDGSDLVMLSGGRAYRRKDIEQFAQELDLLAKMGVTAEPGEHRLHALQLGLVSDAPEFTSPQLHEFIKNARKTVSEFDGIPSAPIDPVTLKYLRHYQRAGADFLVWAARTFGGALLADDMGLGKTLQLLAALTALRTVAAGQTDNQHPALLPSLVICPASVAHNWQREAAKFAPGIRTLVLESGAARKADLLRLAEYDLVVINYALLRRDLPELLQQRWLCVIIDEAQAIKNPAAETSRAVKQLIANYRFALTGTPIENRISDLFSIVEFALPGYLSGIDLSGADAATPAAQATLHQALRARLRPVLLRRLKGEVATELPERIETRADCEMGPNQRKLYLAELKRARTMLDEMEGTAFRSTGKIQMLAALMRLRQICCDPVLVNKPDVHSCKVDQLLEIVQPLIDAGHKVLLFSQFVKMLQHLHKTLDASGVKTYMLTGATSRRQQLVEAFEKDADPSVFLISLKAGGTGLNLISASHVVLFDPWWNPAVEAQAIDRSHRIGQDKTVVAYRLVTSNTIEERILELQEKKRALVRNVLEEEAFNRTLTRDDFQYLLT